MGDIGFRVWGLALRVRGFICADIGVMEGYRRL